LAALQRRTLQQGQPLGLEDVDSVLRALADRLTPGTGPALGGPQFVLKVQGTGEKMAYHRELVFNLVGPKPLLTLGEEALTETLTAVFQPRVFTAADQVRLLDLSFSQQEGLGILRILDTLYKATFSRTIRKPQCDPKVFIPLVPGSFRLQDSPQRTARFMTDTFDLIRQLLYQLYRTPDLTVILDNDEAAHHRVQTGLRFFTEALRDAQELPKKKREVESFLRAHRDTEPGEVLEELPQDP
jgi:hypothetical protein